MALTAGNLTSLKSHHQRVACRFVSFPEIEVTNFEISPGAYSFSDMVNFSPRFCWVDNSGEILIDGSVSVQHSGAASTGHVWTLTGESGGAAAGAISGAGNSRTYTAPAAGSGVDRLVLGTDGYPAGVRGYIAYGSNTVNVGAVTAFHADIESGGWEMTIRAYGDCSNIARQKIVLLVIDAYWNGSASTFGGYASWSNGVFVGIVDRMRTIHEDSEHTYVEVKLTSPLTLYNFAECEPMFWATAGAAEEITVAALKVQDVVYAIMEYVNDRFNVYPFVDDLAITNLKLSRGPLMDVASDVAARSFVTIYSSRVADVYVRPDINIRYTDYYGAHSAVFAFTKDLFEAIDVYSQDYTKVDDPPDPIDPTVGQVVMTAIQPDLTEIWARSRKEANYISGKRVEVNGLICEDAPTLETWAIRYSTAIDPQVTADIRVFLFPVVDLYMQVELDFTPDSGRVTNSGIEPDVASGFGMYITSINFDIDPGMGTWQGAVHVQSYAGQGDYLDNIGENSDD